MFLKRQHRRLRKKNNNLVTTDVFESKKKTRKISYLAMTFSKMNKITAAPKTDAAEKTRRSKNVANLMSANFFLPNEMKWGLSGPSSSPFIGIVLLPFYLFPSRPRCGKHKVLFAHWQEVTPKLYWQVKDKPCMF